MKLTNTIRDAFVRAAMQDVPHVDYLSQVVKAYKDAELQEFTKICATAGVGANAAKKLLAALSDAGMLNTRYVGGMGLSTRIHWPFNIAEPHKHADYEAMFKPILDGHKAQCDTNDSLYRQLRAVAYGCTTRKALVAALPEFEKYLPADEQAACKTLPAIANVVSDFVKAGWPKQADKTVSATKV